MGRKFFTLVVACAMMTSAGAMAQAEVEARPNFLVIVADDLGFSDLGAFGGEIRTPNLDRLALQGVRFTDFHTTPACSPTRAMVLTGADPHQVGLGSMDGMVTPAQRGQPGYQTTLSTQAVTLPEILAQSGYRTLLSGKWHLGSGPGQDPHQRGFQKSFALLPAAHNHFGTDFSAEPGRGVNYSENGKLLNALPASFYSSDEFATRLVAFLREDAASDGGKQTPFFAYLAFSAPHTPLQAHPQDIAQYRGVYDEGFDVLRARRLERLAKLGLIDAKAPAHARLKPEGGWNALSPEDKAMSARDMEVFAAMVDNLDRNVGRVIAELKRTGALDNTVVIFLSDNGPEGMDFRNTEIASMRRRYEAADNTMANRGAATSFVSYGPGWASASAAPGWLYKTYSTEGGTRVASFVFGPKHLLGERKVAHAFATAADILPTVLDWAGAKPTAAQAGRPMQPLIGRSWRPTSAVRPIGSMARMRLSGRNCSVRARSGWATGKSPTRAMANGGCSTSPPIRGRRPIFQARNRQSCRTC